MKSLILFPKLGCSQTLRGCTETFGGCTEAFRGCTETLRGCTEALRGCSQTLQGCTEALREVLFEVIIVQKKVLNDEKSFMIFPKAIFYLPMCLVVHLFKTTTSNEDNYTKNVCRLIQLNTVIVIDSKIRGLGFSKRIIKK